MILNEIKMTVGRKMIYHTSLTTTDLTKNYTDFQTFWIEQSKELFCFPKSFVYL